MSSTGLLEVLAPGRVEGAERGKARRRPDLQPVCRPPLLSIVIPLRNEEDNILPLLEEIQAAAASGPEREGVEVICVDDGSGDDTRLRLIHAQRRFPALRCYAHAESCGQSAAIHSGILRARGALVLTMDGDGQNDPADIPKLLQALQAACPDCCGEQPAGVAGAGPVAMVTGIRIRRRDTALKRVSSRVANAIRDRALHDGITDSGCGLRIFLREAYLRLPYFDHMHRFLPALMQRQGYAVLQLPVGHRPRLRGQSNYGLWNRAFVGVVDLLGVLWLQRRCRRPSAVVDVT